MTSDCQVDTPPRDYAEARAIYAAHNRHDARCLRALVSGAALSADLDED